MVFHYNLAFLALQFMIQIVINIFVQVYSLPVAVPPNTL